MKEGETMTKFTNWPVRYKELLALGNFNSNIGVVCHWTTKDSIVGGLDKKTFAVAGQLYSRDLGVSCIIRNVLAHPYLDCLILCGNEGTIEETKSSQALLNLINNGVDENHFIIGSGQARIEREIPIEKIELFRSRVKVVDLIGENDPLKIQKAVSENLKEEGLRPYEIFVFPEPQKTENLELPSERIVFIVRRSKVAECWIDILKNIMLFGAVKGSQYGERQKELMDLVTVVEAEDIRNPHLPQHLSLSKDQIKDYIPTLTTPKEAKGQEYTYGKRLRAHGGVDQIKEIIDLIAETPYSRRGVASTWNVELDHGSESPPCLDLFQVLVQKDKLFLTVYIRSNDMFLAWPENAFGILGLQELIIGEVNQKNPGLKLSRGSIITISSSAHIYERNWEEAKNILKENPKLQCAWDPRGNFVIDVSDGLINVYNTVDPVNLRWQGKSAQDLSDQMIFYVSQIPHAAYLGRELMRAEFALKKGLEYKQDH
ncbi:MAG: thymidylate synthase, partial [Candidatus Nealsonbacteria bacterium]|nr:thymidylate synthase [Candidatus Nealsonbacteria bacterium]